MLRRTGILSMLALTSYLFCGMTAPTQCKSSGSVGGFGKDIAIGSVVAGAVIATAIIVPVEISHNHHNLKGCVLAGANGLQVQQQGDSPKTFTLVGDTPGVKVGDLVKLHGLKKKAKKGTGDDPTFVFEKISKDYGPCNLSASAPVNSVKP